MPPSVQMVKLAEMLQPDKMHNYLRTAQIAQSILIGWSGSNGQTSENDKMRN